MRYAVMSDAHANPAALNRAVADAGSLGCDRFLFLGDATGYGYDAAETVRIIRDRFDVSVIGNHDAVACGIKKGRHVLANRNYDIDRLQGATLSSDDLGFLRTRHVFDDSLGFALAHGSFVMPEQFEYISSPWEAKYNFIYGTGHDLMFCGHLHHAQVWSCGPRVGGGYEIDLPFDASFCATRTRVSSRTLDIARGTRYIVNAGSVGYPRNDGYASYVVYDDVASKITFRLLPFDYEDYLSHMKERRLKIPGWVMEAVSSKARRGRRHSKRN